MELDHIFIKGAREHNLKNINVKIPKKKLSVLTGVSGSGKSSLAFDTLYAEGQRRYVESLSAYARQFLGQMEKPKYETIRGLSPTISIEQKTTGSNPRSKVCTITEISDYLRVLFARVGLQHCHLCGKKVAGQTAQQIGKELLAQAPGERLILLSSLLENRKGEHRELLADVRRSGFLRLRVDGEMVMSEDVEALDKRRKHNVDVVIDRLVLEPKNRSRINESVEKALEVGNGILTALTGAAKGKGKAKATKKKAAKKRAKGATSAKRAGPQPSAAKAKENATRAKRGGDGAKRVSALDAAATVLQKVGKPMRSRELITAMAEQGLWSSPAGKTPHATLYAAILREIGKKGDAARFKKVDRGLFAVNNTGA